MRKQLKPIKSPRKEPIMHTQTLRTLLTLPLLLALASPVLAQDGQGIAAIFER
jgi:hypothetical protein